MRWRSDATVINIAGLKKENLLTKLMNGGRWDLGLTSYLNTARGAELFLKVHPRARD